MKATSCRKLIFGEVMFLFDRSKHRAYRLLENARRKMSASPLRTSSCLSATVWFIIWTSLSFFAHNFARNVIKAVNHPAFPTDTVNKEEKASSHVMWFCILMLTLFQIGIGSVVLLVSRRFYLFCGGRRGNYRSSVGTPSPDLHNGKLASANGGSYVLLNIAEDINDSLPQMSMQLQITLALTHLVATLATNASIAFATAAPAFIIKAFEPITTAVLSAMVSGKRVETHVILSLPLVAVGAVGFTWRSDFRISNFFGIFMAVISNIMFGLRNIGIKSILHDPALVSKINPTFCHLYIIGQMSVASGTALACILLLQSFVSPGLFEHYISSNVITFSALSGMFHVSYTMISVIVMLTVLSVVGHATANLGKRVIISLLFYIIGWQPPTSANIFFGLIFLIGLFIYANSKKLKLSETPESQSLILSVIFTIFVLIFAFMPNGIFLPSNDTKNHLVDSNGLPSEKSEVVILSQQSVRYRKDFFIKKENKIDFVDVDESNVDILYPNYQTALSNEEEEFLNVDIFKNPNRADWLSKRLPVASDVVLEAQRIHYHLFSRLTKGYRRAVLVNVFTWANRGDHLITIGERVILSRFNLSLEYYCFYPGDDCDFRKISRSHDLVVFIQGAGYIGHEAHVPVVRKTIKAFPNNRVIIFPISVCCTSKEEIAAYQDIFSTHKDLSMLLRDRFSYEISLKSFKTTKLFLSPDSAFAVGPQRLTIVPTHDIMWVKRDDWENYRDKNHDQIPQIPKNMTALVQDWDEHFMDQETSDFMEDHQLKASSAFVYLARGKVVITDRLHAHLMSTLLGKPNIVVNSITRKQQNYYDTWEKSIKTSACVDSAAEAFTLALNFIHTLQL